MQDTYGIVYRTQSCMNIRPSLMTLVLAKSSSKKVFLAQVPSGTDEKNIALTTIPHDAYLT